MSKLKPGIVLVLVAFAVYYCSFFVIRQRTFFSFLDEEGRIFSLRTYHFHASSSVNRVLFYFYYPVIYQRGGRVATASTPDELVQTWGRVGDVAYFYDLPSDFPP